MGSSLPWPYVFALRSAALRSGLERVVLYHTDTITDHPVWQALQATPGLEMAQLDVDALFETVSTRHAALSDLYRRLPTAVGRSNMLRAALLARDGGIYLDMDTVTVAPLVPLLQAKQFVGVEHIVHPHVVRTSRNPVLKLRSALLSGVRDGLRILPRGYRYFRPIEGWYYQAVNGAILGSIPGGPLMVQYLNAMLDLPPDRQLVKHGVGTHLLQQQVAAYQGDDLVIHPPAVFYPLPPEISEHWFKHVDDADPRDALHDDTRIVHWYASVRTKHLLTKIDPDYVRVHAGDQLYSALVRPFVP